jgi:hypothetical protein
MYGGTSSFYSLHRNKKVLFQNFRNSFEYKFGSFQLTWHEAREFCKKESMQLAELKTEAQRNFVLEKLNAKYPFFGLVPFESLWIGGKKSADSNRWTWASDEEQIKYEIPWKPNHSFNEIGGEYCLNLVKYTDRNGATKFGFNDDPCDRRDNFLCELLDRWAIG